MSHILAIETTSRQGSLAVLREGSVIGEQLFPEGFVHGREAVPRIEALLRAADLAPFDLDAIAVGIGPGSYTGSRVGVTAAKTMAWALRIPVVPVSTFEVIAAGVATTGYEGSLVVLLDARRGDFFLGVFDVHGRQIRRIEEDQIGRPDTMTSLVEGGASLVGEGVDAYAAITSSTPVPRLSVNLDLPRASILGELASPRCQRATFDEELVHGIEPAYLRPSEPERRIAERQQREGPT